MLTIKQIITHNHKGDARRADVFLRAAVDHAVARHVERTREDVGRHIGDEEGAACGQIIGDRLRGEPFHAVDGFVRAKIDVIRLVGQLPCIRLGEVEEFAAAVVGVGNNVACAATGTRVTVGFFLGFE